MRSLIGASIIATLFRRQLLLLRRKMQPPIIPQNAKIALSQARAGGAPLPEKGSYTLWDTKVRYLGLRIHAGGSRVWIVQKKLGKKPCRFNLGAFPDMTYTKACSLVAEVVSRIAKGIDPNLEKRQQIRETAEARRQETFSVLTCFEAYVTSKADLSNKPKAITIVDLNRSLGRIKGSKISPLPLSALTGAILDEYFGETANGAKRLATNVGRTQAGRDLRYLRAAYNHCAEKYALELPARNPFLALNKLRPKWYVVKAKKRYVGRVEGQLQSWWEAVEGNRWHMSDWLSLQVRSVRRSCICVSDEQPSSPRVRMPSLRTQLF